MSTPTVKDVHVDAALTAISVGFKNQAFIADRVFQNVPVNKQSDYYYKFLKGAWFRNDAGVRAPGTVAKRSGYPVTTGSYFCPEYAFGHPIPIEMINNADAVLRPWQTGVNFVTNAIQLAKEKIVSDLVVTHTNWTTSDDVEAGWVGDSNSTFITDILARKETVRKLIGVYPNVLLMDTKTFKEVKQTPDVLDRIKYSGTSGAPADVTTQTIAQLFELDEVLLGGAIYSDAEEIVAGTDFNAVDLWEETATKGTAFLYYRPPAPSVETPAAGYIFNWKGDQGQLDTQVASDIYRTVRYWWESDIKSYIVEASEYFVPKVVGADAGCCFYDTIVT